MTSVTDVIFLQCFDCWLGYRKGIRPIKLCKSSSKIIFQNMWRKDSADDVTLDSSC